MIVKSDTVLAPVGDEWRAMREQAEAVVKSGFLPRAINTPEKALTVIMTGRELGLGPMQALRHVHVVDGKPVLSSELIAGMVLRNIPGAKLRVRETSSEKCVVEAARPGDEPTVFTFTIDDAKSAGLTGKDNWRKYPRAMLQRRAIAEAARSVFPDATMGAYDPDELGLVTDRHGDVIDVEPVERVPAGNPEQLCRALDAFAVASTEDELRAAGAIAKGLQNGERQRAMAAFREAQARIQAAASADHDDGERAAIEAEGNAAE